MPRKRVRPVPTKEQIEQKYSYDPESGLFYYREKSGRCNAGDVAGACTAQGDVRLSIGGMPNQAHFLAWTVVHGTPPIRRVRHINGNPADNRIANLYMEPDKGGLISHADLLASLSYDPETGVFHWLRANARLARPGDVAGHLDTSEGYVRIGLAGRSYKAHRLAWFYVYGRWPDAEIDHINRDRADNRICNLREADDQANACNASVRKDNTTGFKGVCFHKRQNKYGASISKNRKLHHLGFFNTPEEAHAAYVRAAAELHGDFAHTG